MVTVTTAGSIRGSSERLVGSSLAVVEGVVVAAAAEVAEVAAERDILSGDLVPADHKSCTEGAAANRDTEEVFVVAGDKTTR